ESETTMSEKGSEKGNITLVVAALLVVSGLVMAGVIRLGAASAGRARAQAAADAAALAGAADGEPAAAAIAADNAAELTSFETVGDDVLVTVRRGRHTARARARWEPRDEFSDDALADPTAVSAVGSRTLRIR